MSLSYPVSCKRRLTTSDNLLISIQEKIKWADSMGEVDKKHKKEVEERVEEVKKSLSTKVRIWVLLSFTVPFYSLAFFVLSKEVNYFFLRGEREGGLEPEFCIPLNLETVKLAIS